MHQHKSGIESALKETKGITAPGQQRLEPTASQACCPARNRDFWRIPQRSKAGGFLDKLHNEISRTLEKIGSREKYINNQLQHLIQEYRAAQAQLSEQTRLEGEKNGNKLEILPYFQKFSKTKQKARERYQQGNGGVTERTRLLSEVTEELEKVKQEMEEKGSSMTDGAPLVKIKQSLTKLKQETIQMDIRIGVVEHTLLQSKLKEKSNMTRDMHATIIPESAIGSY
eukprot:bmy_20876T0